MNILVLAYIAIVIVSVVIHEVAHGYAADALGDPTARIKGRLSLNPLVHLDWIGSIALPLLLIILFPGGPLFGWAKPVPFNPYNLRVKKWGGALVALAGPVSNIILAILVAVILFFLDPSVVLTHLLEIVILTNITLAVFNLVPIPPLDGHHILFAMLPHSMSHIADFLRRYGFIFVIGFILWGWRLIHPIIWYLHGLLV